MPPPTGCRKYKGIRGAITSIKVKAKAINKKRTSPRRESAAH
jgi:hypothetical protein